MDGITFAQDPATAKYDGMPRAAIATQMIDVVAPPAEIAAKVTSISKHPVSRRRRSTPSTGRRSTTGSFVSIFRLLLPACGVNFSHYKTPTIIRRLFRRMALLRMDDVDAYIAHLEQTPLEVVNLHNDLLIHVTRFFREPESFEMHRARGAAIDRSRRANPCAYGWRDARQAKRSIRSRWSIRDVLGDTIDDGRVQIFGTDVSESAVGFARQGLYPASIADDVAPERLRQFFAKTDGGYQVDEIAPRHVRVRAAGSDARSAVLAS